MDTIGFSRHAQRGGYGRRRKPLVGGDLYASPDGTIAAQGTLEDPVSLDRGLAQLRPGGTLYLMDGIYEANNLNLGLNNYQSHIVAVDGARPIIVGADGLPPGISIYSNTQVDGIWFGGNRPETDTGSRTIQVGRNCIVEDCTLFGYINGIQNGSDAHGNIFRRIRFANCGYGFYSHPIYVANMNASLPEHGVLTEDCIVVGGEGFGVHYYHEPAYGLAQYNFIGDVQNGLAVQGDGDGPVSGNRNIIWGCATVPLYHSTGGTCDHNVWRGCSQPLPGAYGTFDNNYFVSPVPTSGTNPAVWQEADVIANLGKSSAEIDAAIAALKTKFTQTVAQIQADATIEAEFAGLKSVIDTWKLVG